MAGWIGEARQGEGRSGARRGGGDSLSQRRYQTEGCAQATTTQYYLVTRS